jgi:hypothetical protein
VTSMQPRIEHVAACTACSVLCRLLMAALPGLFAEPACACCCHVGVLQEPRALLFTYTIVNSAELTATATVCVSTQWAADTSGYRPVARADNFTVIALQENTLQVREWWLGSSMIVCHSRRLTAMCA